MNNLLAPSLTLLQSYQLGLVLGMVVLSTLILFPGRDSNSNAPPQSSPFKEQNKNATSTNQPASCSAAMDQTDMDVTDWRTPHKRLNRIVYGVILVVVIGIFLAAYAEDSPHHTKSPLRLLELYWRVYIAAPSKTSE